VHDEASELCRRDGVLMWDAVLSVTVAQWPCHSSLSPAHKLPGLLFLQLYALETHRAALSFQPVLLSRESRDGYIL